MKAIVCRKYGPPELLRLEEVEKPVPGDDEVLVEVRASAVSTHNLCSVTGKPFFIRLMGSGLLKPRVEIPGTDLAGRVEAVGSNAKRFRPGDEVYGDVYGCGRGAYAEYVSVPEESLAPKPKNVSFEEAAAVPLAGRVALQGLRDKGRIGEGEKVLVFGASGAIGTFAVQLAKYFGAEVTGVCSTSSVDMVRSLGADHVVDYTREDVTKSGRTYDLIFAVASRSILDYRRALSARGRYVSTGAPSVARIVDDMLVGPLISMGAGKKVVGGWAVKASREDLVLATKLVEAGKLRPVVGRCFPLREAAEAFRHYGRRHLGSIVVSVAQGES